MTALTEALAKALKQQLLLERLAACLNISDARLLEHYVPRIVAASRKELDQERLLVALDGRPIDAIGFFEEVYRERKAADAMTECQTRANRAHASMRKAVQRSWGEIQRVLSCIVELGGEWEGPFVRYGPQDLENALRHAGVATCLSQELVRKLPERFLGGPDPDRALTPVLFIDEVFVGSLAPLLAQASPEEAAYLLECVPPGPGWGVGLGADMRTRDAVQGALNILVWQALKETTVMDTEDFEGITDWSGYRAKCVPVALSLLETAKPRGEVPGDPFDWFILLADMLEDRWFRWTRREPFELLLGAIQGFRETVARRDLTFVEAELVVREVASVSSQRHLRALCGGVPKEVRGARVRKAIANVLRGLEG